jgi:CspA family cold shock protein
MAPGPFSPPGSGKVVEGTVKWFNAQKGFGFVAVSDGTEAFLHVSALEQVGLGAPSEGATIKCEIGPGKKGPQVTRVIEVSGGGTAAPRPRFGGGPGGGGRPAPRQQYDDPAALAGAVEVEGTVKWFSPERGYGFVAAADGGNDVFVHSEQVRRAGLPTLLPDQRVSLMVVTTQKGREARSVRAI